MELKKSNVAEVKLSYSTKIKASDRVRLTNPRDVYSVLNLVYADYSVDHIEHFVVVLLDRANKVLGYGVASIGGVNSTVVDLRVVFQFAILGNATGIIVSHNHPSGEVNPSEEDKNMTKKLIKGCEILGFAFVDHVIYTKDKYFSFAEEGLI